ncbi:FAD/NAD(P)-binding domain-containing protein [Wolfiporia cocos MD-104 SS10]|uniref:FAD/NAD(P)-binding domain-containing protein n=1 Tax=Wolfiporia cocos (strain MD-104) TaxID=742152 RepID=A0A2H3IZP3_WOLCO|nr:FAD/NAD(P)-binding domain-containing protein [Wolfiporia cocos MD-104 SS10]
MAAAAAPLAPTAAPALDKVSLPTLTQTVAPDDDLKPTLPTLDRLGASLQPDVDVQKVASEFFRAFAQHVSANNVEGITSLFLDDGWWRDQLALTWEFRTFHGVGKIRKFLADQLAGSGIALGGVRDVALQQPYPDLAWIQAFFDFETSVGIGSGVFRLVPTASGIWKAFTMYTNLEDLKGFPEKIGIHREFLPNHGKWKRQREQERAFLDKDPEVLIVGGGQSGLDVAARLKWLGVPALIVESSPRIGSQWRGRYEALCLHDPIWYDHLPYMPFPPSWPVYTPAQKLADWLEYYAEAMELNVWTSTTATEVRKDAEGRWRVTVRKADGTERTFHPDHVVMALGFGGGLPNMPTVPGQEEFQGQVLHSTQHKSARDHVGKKVIVIGAATSAHDICSDYAEHGVDVTMYQQSPTYVMTTREGAPRLFKGLYWEGAPPVDVADRLHNSLPILATKELHKRVTAEIAEADKELLQGLKRVGFKYNFGHDDSGFLFLAQTRGGGYYLDVGTSKKIIDGKIKLKNDSPLERFTKTGLKFQDGSELEADVVLFATGFEGAEKAIYRLVGDELGSQIGPIWNLTPEGEQRGAWRWLGVQNLWFMMGNLAMCRFHSKHLALQILAIQKGLYGKRYAD